MNGPIHAHASATGALRGDLRPSRRSLRPIPRPDQRANTPIAGLR
jgi:hypothetical protein